MDPGSWDFYDRVNAIAIQKFVVPWSIAQYGLDYTKKLSLEVVKEILIALCDAEGFLLPPPERTLA